LPLMQLASFYAVNHLRSTFITYLAGNLNTEIACTMIVAAEQLNEKELFQNCFQYIVVNAQEVFKSKYFLEHITPDIFEKLLQQNDVAMEEIDLFKALVDWIKYDKSRHKYKDNFFSYIRFPTMSAHQLIDVVEPSKMVPLETVYKALAWHHTHKGFASNDIAVTYRITWNWKACGSRATLQGNSVICFLGGYALAIGDRLPPRWSVRIESIHPMTDWWSLAVGVTKDGIDLNNYITCGTFAWAYYSVGAFLHNCGNPTTITTKPFGPQDIITVLKTGSQVTFLKNGENVGSVTVPDDVELFPCVHISKADTKIIIVQ